MLNNRIPIIIVSIVLVVSVILGVVLLFSNKEETKKRGAMESSNSFETSDIVIDAESDNSFEHIVGKPVVEFDEGNEMFLDTSLVAYLERMEFGVPAIDENGNYYFDSDGDIVYDMSEEKHLEYVLDNLIMIINHFAREGYSLDASQQIQRFYVKYYDRFLETKHEDLVADISKCFSKEGADSETLQKSILDVFGFISGDEFAFVFKPFKVSEIKVEFYNVIPSNIVLTDEEKQLCIYDTLNSGDGDNYERNLEGWLHNFIRIGKDVSLDNESIIIAQILYARTIADAEYRSDWAQALVRCMTIKDMSYDNLKIIVESEFGVCVDNNAPLIDYFESRFMEVIS